MVCNLTVGKPKYAAHEATMQRALARAGELRRRSLRLAQDDAEAFAAVSAAYRLPRETDDERAARSAAIQGALIGAAGVPLQTAEAAAEVVHLTEEIVDGANVNVVSDVAVAASSARAGLEAATVNVEINLSAMDERPERSEVAARLERCQAAASQAGQVVAQVRRKITS